MSVYRNAASTLIFQMSALLLNSIINIMIARILGPELLGNYQLFINTTMFLTLALSFGMDVALSRSTATGEIPLTKITGGAWLMVIAITLSTIGITMLSTYIDFIRDILPKDFLIPQAFNDSFFMLMLGFMSFCYTIKLYFSAILNGKQLFLQLNILQTVVVAFNLIAYLLILWAKAKGILVLSFEQFFFINAAFFGITGLTALWVFWRQIKLPAGSWLPNIEEWRNLFRFSGNVYLGLLFQFLNYRLSVWFLNAYVGKSELGIFTQALQLCQILWFISAAASNVLFPFISSIPAKDGERYVNVFHRTVFWATFACAIAGTILSYLLVPILYGNDYSRVSDLVALMVWGFVLMSCSKILTMYMLRNNQLHWMLQGNAIGASTNALCNIILIPIYGFLGTAWAMSISFTVSFGYIFWRYSNYTGTSWKDLFLLSKSDILDAIRIIRKK